MSLGGPFAPRPPIVIAHRGASAYLPEHTLAAKALAIGMGADYIEQDVVATRDHELVVMHDITLDTVCNVAERYPDRRRHDGHYYVADFDLAELATLSVRERRAAGGAEPHYPNRFPASGGAFRIPTFKAELEMVRGLERSRGLQIGIYPEIKRPAWHRQQGIDLSQLVIDQLAAFDYRIHDDPVFLQCFDLAETRRIRTELGCELPLIQLIGENSWAESDTDYSTLQTADGLKTLAELVDGIGPWIEQLIDRRGGHSGRLCATSLATDAHAVGLAVHPYTARADDLPAGFETLEALFSWLVDFCEIDGLFTDFPDRFRDFVDSLASRY